MKIFYIIFGENLGNHIEAYLSMTSFRRQLGEGDEVCVVTTHPEYYNNIDVTVIPISNEQISEWESPHHYFWRVKIKAVEYMHQRYPNDHIIYLDTDTFLFGDLNALRSRLNEGKSFMHLREGGPETYTGNGRKMWNMAKGKTFAGITLSESHAMWNAGVIGLPASKLEVVTKTALTICDGILDLLGSTHVIEQYSFSVALQELTDMTEAQHFIAHYWGNKPEWEQWMNNLIVKAYMTKTSVDDVLMQMPLEELCRVAPVYVRTPSTQKRLVKLVQKLFPQANHSYAKPTTTPATPATPPPTPPKGGEK